MLSSLPRLQQENIGQGNRFLSFFFFFWTYQRPEVADQTRKLKSRKTNIQRITVKFQLL